MSKPRVFVSRVIPNAGLDRIRRSCDAEVWALGEPPSPEVLREKISKCDGAVTLLTDRIDRELLGSAPRLRVLSNFAVGFDNIDVGAASERGIAVGNTPDVLTDATADMAFALMIAAARRIEEGARAVRAGEWKTWEPLGYRGRDLGGRTLGIVGMGRIGESMARRCHGGWQMNLLYADPASNRDVEEQLGARRVDLPTLLREADFVSVHAALTPETRGMIGAGELALMKPTAVLVNTARGEIIDQRALVEALRSGGIFAAGLDVTDPEPLPSDHELLRLPNALITPHIASATVRARDAMARIAADNLIAGIEGRPLPSPVNPEVRPRASSA